MVKAWMRLCQMECKRYLLYGSEMKLCFTEDHFVIKTVHYVKLFKEIIAVFMGIITGT